ncbi:disintegrin and metalloproteinase domain-containing protein 20-like [Lepus europaeus]|uniref:disintegrin and metalloproteinase domain-containing protein 20-like n=1 Tax=Lepus europaeus TaxID=9983 RepID=UPI002B4A4F0D|nr:disintegrin and metalloproteinase domain-containing protein 20-like [Lepus europaeus]
MAVAEVLLHGRFTVLKLWLGVGLFLSGWLHIGHSQQHKHSEVVIPLRLTGTGKGMKTPGWLSYSLHIEGQRHIIHMKVRKLLASRHFPVFTYTDEGALHEDQPFIQDDCHYQGYVEGQPESTVALSSCFGGLQGMLQINGIVYEIKPIKFSTTHEHLIHRRHYNETEFQSTEWQSAEEIAEQLGFQDSKNRPLMQESYEWTWTHRWNVEYAVIQDHPRFLFRNGNITWMIQDAFVVMNEVNSIYSKIDVFIALVGLEIWNEENYLSNYTDITRILNDFCDWKMAYLDGRMPNDVAHIWVYFQSHQTAGSKIGSVCKQNSCGAVNFLLDDNLFEFVLLVAHEMGHNLNMYHDYGTCTCGAPTCIMSEGVALSEVFSNCSIHNFFIIVQRTTCMRDTPNRARYICGDGLIDGNEQCDCGTYKQCEKDACCFANCTLKPGAVCASGLCCKDCQFREIGELCREQENECDLPEWCNGTSQECPEDVYVRNGQTCMETSQCYNKICPSREMQCKQIFGEEAMNAKELCYSEMNTRGDRFGNCGNDTVSYTACNTTDVMCGRIQCDGVRRISINEDHTSVHWVNINGTSCWGTDYHFGMTIADIGDVKDGTQCNENSVCVNRKCAVVVPPLYTCSPKFCHEHGVCNSKDHCHCDSKWAPPTCELEGVGGSIDSGPPGIKKKKQKQQRSILYIWLLILLILLLLLLLCLFCFLCKKRKSSEEKEKTAPPPQGTPGPAPPPQGTPGPAPPPPGKPGAAAPPPGGPGAGPPPKAEKSAAPPPKPAQSASAPPKAGQSPTAPPK